RVELTLGRFGARLLAGLLVDWLLLEGAVCLLGVTLDDRTAELAERLDDAGLALVGVVARRRAAIERPRVVRGDNEQDSDHVACHASPPMPLRERPASARRAGARSGARCHRSRSPPAESCR